MMYNHRKHLLCCYINCITLSNALQPIYIKAAVWYSNGEVIVMEDCANKTKALETCVVEPTEAAPWFSMTRFSPVTDDFYFKDMGSISYD